MLVKITKKLIRGFEKQKKELMLGQDGEYLTNGHWMIRKDLTSCEFAPVDGRNPPCKEIISQNQPEARTVVRTDLVYEGLELLVSLANEPVCWARPELLDAFSAFALLASGPLDPIFLMSGDKFVGAVMPAKQIDLPKNLLANLIRQ